MKIFGKEVDSHKIIEAWHLTGMIVTGVGMVAAEAAPLIGTNSKAAAIVGGIGAISLTTTSIMNRIAHNKLVVAIINDPNTPTPQGLGIPKPTNPDVIAQLQEK